MTLPLGAILARGSRGTSRVPDCESSGARERERERERGGGRERESERERKRERENRCRRRRTTSTCPRRRYIMHRISRMGFSYGNSCHAREFAPRLGGISFLGDRDGREV